MTANTTAAVRAGFSGNVPIGKLGLFGMGFNISSGKIGKKTVFKTACREEQNLVSITINLPKLVKGGAFDVPIEESPKPLENYYGVEVDPVVVELVTSTGVLVIVVVIGSTTVKDCVAETWEFSTLSVALT